MAKRGYHPPPTSVTPARTKRTEGGSPYSKRTEGGSPYSKRTEGGSPFASGYNSSEEYDAPRRADPEVGGVKGGGV